ncbi:MAG TPA: hypothetical protein VHF58_06285 [Solirubrobacterales bacterium]|nr:hypothetical protein [Solirubrobacterales bacterium]
MNEARNAVTVRRRGFFALGGAGVAAAALSACGTEAEEPNDERDIEIFAAALVGEENAANALKAAEREATGADADTVRALAQQAEDHATRLQELLADLDATPEGAFEILRDVSLDEALQAATDQTNHAVAAYARGAGQLTEEFRADAIELAAADGARLAVLAGMLGADPAPFAFVTGREAEPHETVEGS